MCRPAVALCCFCEIHGPRVMFTSENLCDHDLQLDRQDRQRQQQHHQEDVLLHRRDSDADNTIDPDPELCEGCTSLPPSSERICSRHDKFSAVWRCSHQHSFYQRMNTLLNDVCSRTLTCETPSPDSGVMYFGDDVRCHVVSHNFALHDAAARGLQRRYSIVVVSRHQHRLLSSWIRLCECLRHIISQLRACSLQVFEREKNLTPALVRCSFPLFLEMSDIARADGATGQAAAVGEAAGSNRGLAQLTAVADIYQRLHEWFGQLLDVLIRDQAHCHQTMLDGRHRCAVLERPPISAPTANYDACGVPGAHDAGALVRAVRAHLSAAQFSRLVSQLLSSGQLVVRHDCRHTCATLVDTLSYLVPSRHKTISHSEHYLSPAECCLLGVAMTTAVPAGAACCLLQPANHGRWQLQAPPTSTNSTNQESGEKSTLLRSVEAAVANRKLPDCVLPHRLATLRADWIAKCELFGEATRGGAGVAASSLLTSLQCRPVDASLLLLWYSLTAPPSPPQND